MDSVNKISLKELLDEDLAQACGGADNSICPKFKVNDKVNAAYSCVEFEICLTGVVSKVHIYEDMTCYDLKDCYGYYDTTKYNGEPVFNVAEYMLNRP